MGEGGRVVRWVRCLTGDLLLNRHMNKKIFKVFYIDI